MKRFGRGLLPLILALGIALTGCHLLFPEKMDATIEINSDWTYSIEFRGVLTDYVSRSARMEDGALSAEEAKALAELEGSLRADRRFRKVEYLGEERYEVDFRETGVLQEEASIISGQYYAKVLSIEPKPDDHVMVQGVEFKDDAELHESLDALSKAGMSVDWRIRIKTDAEVIAHNAQKTPWLFGLIGAYEWDIDSLEDTMPLMVIKMGR